MMMKMSKMTMVLVAVALVLLVGVITNPVPTLLISVFTLAIAGFIRPVKTYLKQVETQPHYSHQAKILAYTLDTLMWVSGVLVILGWCLSKAFVPGKNSK